MKTLLDKWKPKRWFGKAIKVILNIIHAITTIMFLVIPFLKLEDGWLEAFKWIWVGCAILKIDVLADYKKAKEEKIISPTFSMYTLLTFLYLCNYWHLIPLSVAIVVPLVIVTLEVAISICAYKAIRFTPKQALKIQPAKVTAAILLGSVYASAVSLFILGHFLSEAMIFVFGIIAMIMLFSSVISVISKGFSENKSIVSTIGIILDIVSVLALIGYLIYLTPNGEDNNNLQDIVLSLTSAVIGGAVTLAGVAWTIKRADDDRNAEERKKAEPLFSFNLMMNDNLTETRIICLAFAGEKDTCDYANIAHLTNSDNANFYIRAIKYKNDWCEVSQSNYVIKNHDIYFVFYTPEISVDNFEMYIKMEDALGYYHYYKFGYIMHTNKKGKSFTTMSSMEKVTEDEANE
ncbi:MAG: hypothetical protein IJY69_02805 [Clostridia bacterium]|nr:hypothetical protein [Clostridia bacterium]